MATQPVIKKVCVFCGSSPGVRPEYMQAGRDLGNVMVDQGLDLVYGGGTMGLMGEIAKTVQARAGNAGVLGVIPEALVPKEVSGEMIGETIIVPDMHVRKMTMAEHSDAFIAMPGGFGTMEELLEVITWQQLGFHKKPIGLLNVLEFYTPLMEFFKQCVREGFVKSEYMDCIIVSDDPADLLEKLKAFTPKTSYIEKMHLAAAVGKDISKPAAQAE